jgi:DNA-binding beta-propeller fold protein YncE
MRKLLLGSLLLVVLLGGLAQAQNVGIGTSAPTQTLDIDGGLRVRGLTGSGAGRLLSAAADGTLQVQPPLLGATLTPATAPVSLGTVPTGIAPAALALNPAGTRAYVLNSSDNNLQVYDLSGGALPVSLGTVGTSPSPRALALNAAGTRAYVVNSDQTGKLDVFDLSGAGLPVSLGTVGASAYAVGIALNAAGTRAYVGTNTAAVQAFDLSGTGLPTSLGTAAAGGSPRALATNPLTNRLYVATTANALQVYNTSASVPSSLGTVATGQNPAAVAVNAAGTRAYVLGAADASLRAYDLSGGGVPTLLGTASTDAAPAAVAVYPAGDRVLVVHNTFSGATLRSYDVSGNTPASLGSVPLAGLSRAVAMNAAGTRAYALAGNALQAFDIGGGPRVAVVNADGSLGSLDPAQLPGYARRPVALGSVGSAGTLYATTGNYAVARQSTGTYRLTFLPTSGLSTQDLSAATVAATLFNTPGLVSCRPGTGYVEVFTYDPAGAAADRGFSFSVTLP